MRHFNHCNKCFDLKNVILGKKTSLALEILVVKGGKCVKKKESKHL